MIGVIAIMQSCSKDSKAESIPSADASIPVKVISLQQESRNTGIVATGQFTTNDETLLSFKTGGIVSSVLVKSGDYVRKGQLLATLDLTEINTAVNQATIALEKANRDLQRVTNLHKEEVATLEQLQNAGTAAAIAKQQLDAANFNKTYSEIRAITDGYVLQKFVNAGQLVAPGTPVFQTNGATSGNWILKVGVSDKEWSQINKNDKATISTDAFDKNINGYVINKSESADPFTGSFIIEIAVSENKLPLASGLFGTAHVYPATSAAAWAIPYEALLDGNGNEGFVFVTNDNKTANKIPVTISGISNSTVYISGGLENAKALIVSGSAYLTDNSSINIIK